MSGLTASVELRRGAFHLQAELQVAAGETLALVGPNGSGKSTLLHALAGLLPLQAGRVTLDGAVLEDCATAGPIASVCREGQRVEVHRRGVGLVFQEQLLFPHLDLQDNVAYGARSGGASRAAARERALHWLQRVGLDSRAEARIDQLSGGERQKAALARALAAAPRMLLLDEALAAVDASARTELRRLLREVLADFQGVTVLVAHDALEAFALADRVAVMERGRVVQSGTVAEICSTPRSTYVADLVGLNLLRGQLAERRLTTPGGGVLVTASELSGEVLAAVHPRAVALYRERPSGSPRNVWQAQVESVEAAGDRLRVRFGAPLPLVAEITHGAREELGVRAGEELWLALKATEIAVASA